MGINQLNSLNREWATWATEQQADGSVALYCETRPDDSYDRWSSRRDSVVATYVTTYDRHGKRIIDKRRENLSITPEYRTRSASTTLFVNVLCDTATDWAEIRRTGFAELVKIGENAITGYSLNDSPHELHGKTNAAPMDGLAATFGRIKSESRRPVRT